jgi:hypothetical protein
MVIALLAGSLLMHSLAFADVSYQETTQYTGGSMMGMLKMAGAFSSQAKQATCTGHLNRDDPWWPHGSLQSSYHGDHRPRSADITFIDHDKRTYSMVTFKEIQEQMAKAAAKAKGARPPAPMVRR